MMQNHGRGIKGFHDKGTQRQRAAVELLGPEQKIRYTTKVTVCDKQGNILNAAKELNKTEYQNNNNSSSHMPR